MKNTKVILEGWCNYDHGDEISILDLSDNYSDIYSVKCKVILEVPEQERSVTITESEFDSHWDIALPNELQAHMRIFKNKLFGSKNGT